MLYGIDNIIGVEVFQPLFCAKDMTLDFADVPGNPFKFSKD